MPRTNCARRWRHCWASLRSRRRRERSVEEYRRVLDEVHGEALRLRQIVESLLFMARAESDAGTPELEPIELVLWVRERLACRCDGEHAPEIRKSVTTDPPAWVQAQPAASGAVARQPAGQRLQVQPRGNADHGRGWAGGRDVTLAVQDQGPGIDAGDLAHIFEPFYRSVKSRRRPGVGLGLAVVERIATVFGGTDARGKRGPGTEAGLSSGFRTRRRRSCRSTGAARWIVAARMSVAIDQSSIRTSASFKAPWSGLPWFYRTTGCRRSTRADRGRISWDRPSRPWPRRPTASDP